MNKQLLQYIAHLSKQDKKTISQKGLKIVEELGELAKELLPYDNAFATTHRFPNKEKILEESVDVILTALSIAYSLDFTDEEIDTMMVNKSEKWAGLQANEANLKYPLPFEIHITVDLSHGPEKYSSDPVSWFKATCGQIGVKPIVLDLQNKSGISVMSDVMTSSKHFGTNTSALVEMNRITYDLTKAGYAVVREKIETVPWHPAAPQHQNQPMPQSCYFESHIPIKTLSNMVSSLSPYLKREGFADVHVSQNVFKKFDDGFSLIMLTYREYHGYHSDFVDTVDQIVTSLGQLVQGKVHTEFALYDSKVHHDAGWIKD